MTQMEQAEPGPEQRKPRFLFVDGLRGIAATWVVLFHASEGEHLTGLLAVLPGWLGAFLFHWGDLGVPIFFVLSGFVIAHSLRSIAVPLETGSGIGFLAKFTLKRSIRLDPPYFVSIAFVLGLAWLSATIKSEHYAFPSTEQLTAHLFYLQEYLGFEQISSVYWTLCYEIQFYLVYCLMSVLCHRIFKSKSAIDANQVVLGLVILTAIPWGSGLVDTLPIRGMFIDRWHGFVAGVLAYNCWRRGLGAQFLFLFSLIILVPALRDGNLFNATCVVTSGLLYLAGRMNRMGVWLSSQPFQLAGRFSYSLYLTHNPITGAAFFLIYRLLPRGVLVELVGLVAVLAICYAFSAIYWRLFEKPFMDLSKRIDTKSRPTVVVDAT